jgi:hypothetical protein
MNRWFGLGLVLGLGAGALAVLSECPWQGCLAPGLYLTPLRVEEPWTSR